MIKIIDKPKFYLITGLSGAGKTFLLKSLEDEGYYTVDNVPPNLIKEFMNIACNSDIKKIAIVSDIRWKNTNELKEAFVKLENNKICDLEIKKVFLVADKEELVNRFIKSRRNHPLNLDLEESIEKEISLLNPIKELSDIIIDTSKTEPTELRRSFFQLTKEKRKPLNLHIMSFGFKYGIPNISDYIYDVRYLKNPFYFFHMYTLTGLDEKISNYLMSFNETKITIDKLVDLTRFIQDSYSESGRLDAHFSIGCTGGQHRSVFIAQKVYEKLKLENREVFIIHRDINKK